MAEELPSREILKDIVERLDLLERVLKTNTARLHNIEQQVGIGPRSQSWTEPPPEQRGATHRTTASVEPHSLRSQVEASDVNIPAATPPQPAALQAAEPSAPPASRAKVVTA